MGCWTVYLLRDEDASCLVTWEKYGSWEVWDPDERARLIDRSRRRGIPVDDDRAAGSVDSSFCRGLALDLVDHRMRYYGCDLALPSAAYIDSHAARLAGTATWMGWDVRYAWGGPGDFPEVIPGATPVLVRRDERPRSLPIAPLTSREGWYAGWNPAQEVVSVRHFEGIADWWAPASAVVSVIRPDRLVLDYQLTTRDTVDWLAAHGERIVPALLAQQPYPMPHEETIDTGVVIDIPGRRVRYWDQSRISPSRAMAAATAWPGWSFERLPFGFAGHLAVTARTGEHDLTTDAAATASPWNAELLEIRDRGARALSDASDLLRHCRLAIVDG
ncbi:hypothetical protein [Embleya hyalina]|uniref:Uncharacterized protein n=1 Tax=Embleya hyalina TaxID=516124 RepID=A0A401YQI8_9ACTN|nr:hypothetical protein [Embleya hyalina]GCD96851.1 hypothetical protein EHYA_04538 [Embleya hyalina]